MKDLALQNTKRTNWILVAGLSLLSLPVLSSFVAVRDLGQAMERHRHSLAVQDHLDDLSQSTKDWIIRRQNPHLVNKDPTESWRISEESLQQLEPLLSSDPLQRERYAHVRSIWRDLKEAKETGNRQELLLWNQLDVLLNNIDQTELAKEKIEEPLIQSRVTLLLLLTGVAPLIAFLLIIFAFRAMGKQMEERKRLLQELEKSQEEAVSASKMKSKFLATVSHEIRTPLNGIIGLSDLLRSSDANGRQRQVLETIHQSGKTLLRIINDILDLSKIEAGKIHFENVEFSLLDTIDQVVLSLAPKAGEKSVNLVVDLKPEVPVRVFGDPDRIAQVLFNLVGNAIKFTSFGSVILRISQIGERELEFSVEDTGIGLSAEQIKDLFQPFAQMQKTGTSGEPGTGLGLSISQQLVQMMGGEIQVDSQAGRGSRFFFRVRFSSVSSETVADFKHSPTKRARNAPENLPSFRGTRILVVEDNPTNQLIAQSMLSWLGVDVTLASSGSEALDLVKGQNFDLIFMDCQMPQMDGFETTRKLRDSGIKWPIIALTANAGKSAETACLEAGMDAYLTKPITLESVAGSLSGWCKKSSSSLERGIESLAGKIGEASALRVARSFCDTLPDFRSAFEAAEASGDTILLNRLGHRFKSSALSVGAEEFAALCTALEESASLSAAVSLKQKLFLEIESLKDQLGQRLGSPDSGRMGHA